MKQNAANGHKNQGCIVALCTCTHSYQDSLYGGRRVMNTCNGGYRCTVCSTVHENKKLKNDK